MGSVRAADKRLRIVHLDHTGHSGGAELALKRLLSNQESWDATIVTPKALPGGPDVFATGVSARSTLKRIGRTQSSGISTNRVDGSRLLRLLYDVVTQALMIRASREFRSADVIHANTSRAALYGALAVLFSRKTFVVHLRDMVTAESLGPAGFWAFRNVALRRADGLIGNSESTLNSALRHMAGRKLKTEVIPSPFGYSQSVSRQTREPDPQARVRVGMVARIDPWKGQELLLRAFAARFRGKDVDLLFAGAPAFENESYLERLRSVSQQLGVAEQTYFLGHVADVEAFIHSLDVCVQASLRPEPLGQNVLQYLAAGRATVVSNEGGPTEWVRPGQNGLTFQARDETSLGNVLDEVVRNDNLRESLSTAARLTPGLLSDSEIAERHLEFFRLVFSELRLERSQGSERPG